jgi:oligopeptide transport system ATP-binding protein
VALDTKRPLLEVNDLRTQFFTQDGVVKAVNGVSFTLNEGEALGLVGESGCGKSVSALSLMRLIPQPPGKIVSGEVVFDGRDLLKLKEDDMRKVRGNDIAMIFQDPMTSLNPVLTIGRQISEALELHKGMDRSQARKRTIELLELVGIPSARSRVDDYPHQFSGGMRQRVMIAMALSCEPKLLLADEPTTALDVTIQAQILDLIKRLREELGMAIIMITHDLGVIAEVADDVVVMYAARIAEHAPVDNLFKRPHHPYTWGLLGSLPRLDADVERLVQIRGQPPSLLNPPKGCRFHPRCPYVMGICKTVEPELLPAGDERDHVQACHLDVATKDREAAKVLAGTMAEAS